MAPGLAESDLLFAYCRVKLVVIAKVMAGIRLPYNRSDGFTI